MMVEGLGRAGSTGRGGEPWREVCRVCGRWGFRIAGVEFGCEGQSLVGSWLKREEDPGREWKVRTFLGGLVTTEHIYRVAGRMSGERQVEGSEAVRDSGQCEGPRRPVGLGLRGWGLGPGHRALALPLKEQFAFETSCSVI